MLMPAKAPEAGRCASPMPTDTSPAAMTPDTVLLRAGQSSLTLIPALGGKITSLHLGGREWLWTSDVTPYRVPDESMRGDEVSYVKLADSGGYDECFPTVGPCTLPAGVREFGGIHLPDHGELWSQQPAVSTPQGPDGQRVTVRWVGQRMPYEFQRTVQLGEGIATMHYSVANQGRAPLPFLWSSHPLLPLTDSTRVHLPAGARMRVDAVHGLSEQAMAIEHRWPLLRAGDTEIDLSSPATAREAFACKIFLDLPADRVIAGVEEDGVRLSVAVDGSEVTHCGLWVNNRGWTPFDDAAPYRNLALEPCIGAPDSLANALGEWQSAAWLAPDETRRWTLTWSAAPA